MRFKNEKGVTLVEVLAVLVLVSMVLTLIVTTFVIASRYNITEMKKLQMQQEANYIISAILQKHRTTDAYELLINEDKKIVFKECEDDEDSQVCNGTEIIFGNEFNYTLDGAGIVHPKAHDLETTIIVTDPINPKLFVSVDTTFNRYR